MACTQILENCAQLHKINEAMLSSLASRVKGASTARSCYKEMEFENMPRAANAQRVDVGDSSQIAKSNTPTMPRVSSATAKLIGDVGQQEYKVSVAVADILQTTPVQLRMQYLQNSNSAVSTSSSPSSPQIPSFKTCEVRHYVGSTEFAQQAQLQAKVPGRHRSPNIDEAHLNSLSSHNVGHSGAGKLFQPDSPETPESPLVCAETFQQITKYSYSPPAEMIAEEASIIGLIDLDESIFEPMGMSPPKLSTILQPIGARFAPSVIGGKVPPRAPQEKPPLSTRIRSAVVESSEELKSVKCVDAQGLTVQTFSYMQQSTPAIVLHCMRTLAEQEWKLMPASLRMQVLDLITQHRCNMVC